MNALPIPVANPAFTAFAGTALLRRGGLEEVAIAVRRALDAAPATQALTFDDASGRVVDLDLRGSDDDIRAWVRAWLAANAPAPDAGQAADAGQPVGEPTSRTNDGGTEAIEPARSRGRPRLGVVAREVTLLPRHWDWLGAQPGGASVALRKLVEAARREHAVQDLRREHQERAFRFLGALAGDMPDFEAATRALFADDAAGFERASAGWPADVRGYAMALGAFPD